jgi:hypothetical protein
MKTSLRALNAVNFFMADVQGGLGPFLGIYLQARQWSPAEIGVVMTIGGLAGMLATAPLGALVDYTKAKRTLVIVASFAITLASLVILFVPGFITVAVTQAVSGIAGAAIGPALAGITLGLVGQKHYTHRVGRTQAFNHAGNVTAAVLAGGARIRVRYRRGVRCAGGDGGSLRDFCRLDRSETHRLPDRARPRGRSRQQQVGMVHARHLRATAGAGCHTRAVSSWQRGDAALTRPIAGGIGRQQSQRIHRRDDRNRSAYHGADGDFSSQAR